MSHLPPSPDPRLAPGSVLVVDDEPAVLRRLSEHLTARGHAVVAEGSAERVVEVLGADLGRPRLAGALLDWRLAPGQTGDGVLDWLDEAYPETPVVVLTGLPVEIGRERRRARRIDVAAKPFHPESLDRIVREVFEPWDHARRAARRFLLERASPRHEELDEPLLRMMDACLESVSDHRLGVAWGLEASIARAHAATLRSIFEVRRLDEVRAQWQSFNRPHSANG